MTTDEQGFAELSFVTDELEPIDDNNWWARYFQSALHHRGRSDRRIKRRTIEAQGEVKVARQQYFAFLDAERGYFNQGDRVPIELRTQDANELCPLRHRGKWWFTACCRAIKKKKSLSKPI